MKTIITISRQYGSGGREVAEKLAKEYDIPLYDKQLIKEACKESGYSEDILKGLDEKKSTNFLYSIALDPWGVNEVGGVPLDQKIQSAIRHTILDLSKNGGCVFVGRCADDVLSETPDVLNVFICADKEFRKRRVHKEYLPSVNIDKLDRIIRKKDKERESYHNYYSLTKWGDPETYDLCLNSSKLGIVGCVNIIKETINTVFHE